MGEGVIVGGGGGGESRLISLYSLDLLFSVAVKWSAPSSNTVPVERCHVCPFRIRPVQ